MPTFIGARLRELRIAAGMSQSDLAAKVGVTKGRVSQWETDQEAGIDSLARLEALAAVFQVDVADLLVPPRFAPPARVSRRPKAEVIALPIPPELLGRRNEAPLARPGSDTSAASNPMAGLSALQQAALDVFCKACRAGKVSDEQALALLNDWHRLLHASVVRAG